LTQRGIQIMKILLTGGAGYIGSHSFLALQKAGSAPMVQDQSLNSTQAD
jgi:UDP-glucose 4-epimerase